MATHYVLPLMGQVFDGAKVTAAGSVEALRTLSPAELAEVIRVASIDSFQSVALIPVLLVPIFTGLWLHDLWGRKHA